MSDHLSHQDLGSLDEHRGAGDVEALLQSVQVQLLHLLVAALHLHRVERQHGHPLHLLCGGGEGEGGREEGREGGREGGREEGERLGEGEAIREK